MLEENCHGISVQKINIVWRGRSAKFRKTQREHAAWRARIWITGGISGLRVSAGLPGTGLSFSRKIGAGRRSSGSRLGTLIIVIFVTGLIARACGIQNQESAIRFNHPALEIEDCEDGLESCKPEVAAKLRAALERRARELDWQIRCKPTEYRDAQGLRYLKYAEPDCAGRSLN